MDAQSEFFPVIISESLNGSPISEFFSNMANAKLRMSSTVHRDVCIFPKSSVAFLIIQKLHQINFESVHRFFTVHRSAYLILQMQVIDHNVIDVIAKLQDRLFPDACPLIFASSSSDACHHMLFTANAHFPATMALSSAASEAFVDKACSQQAIMGISMPTLKNNDAKMIMTSFQSLADIANASKQQLIDSGLDHFMATQLLNFFDQDHYLD